MFHTFKFRLKIRLAAIWRESTMIVSRTLSQVVLPTDQTTPSSVHHSVRALPNGQVQATSDSFALCWQSDHFSADNLHRELFRLRVFPTTATSNLLSTHFISSTCYLLRHLPSTDCCRVAISAMSSEETPVGEEIFVDISMVKTSLGVIWSF